MGVVSISRLRRVQRVMRSGRRIVREFVAIRDLQAYRTDLCSFWEYTAKVFTIVNVVFGGTNAFNERRSI